MLRENNVLRWPNIKPALGQYVQLKLNKTRKQTFQQYSNRVETRYPYIVLCFLISLPQPYLCFDPVTPDVPLFWPSYPSDTCILTQLPQEYLCFILFTLDVPVFWPSFPRRTCVWPCYPKHTCVLTQLPQTYLCFNLLPQTYLCFNLLPQTYPCVDPLPQTYLCFDPVTPDVPVFWPCYPRRTCVLSYVPVFLIFHSEVVHTAHSSPLILESSPVWFCSDPSFQWSI